MGHLVKGHCQTNSLINRLAFNISFLTVFVITKIDAAIFFLDSTHDLFTPEMCGCDNKLYFTALV